jgi:hypothetical protein
MMGTALRFAALALLWVAPAASAATFTKIADASSPGMGWGSGVFFGSPALDAGVVAFTAEDFESRNGIFIGSGGGVGSIAEGTSFSHRYSDPSISQGVVAFAFSDGFDTTIYTGSGGGLTVIADSTTPNPDGNGTLSLSDLVTPAIDGANVAFRAYETSGGSEGIFTSVAGVIETSADRDTNVPGGGSGDLFLSAIPRGLDGTQVAFEAFDAATWGVYVADGGVARVVADKDTLIPGTSETFMAFASVAIGGGSVAFEGIGVNAGGLYAEIGGLLVLITDTEVVQSVAADGDAVAYFGNDLSSYGIYVYRNGAVERIIASGEQLDGKTLSGFRFGAHGLDGEQLAFTALFDDGTEGVFLATIPEPDTALLFVAGLAVIGMSRRSGR